MQYGGIIWRVGQAEKRIYDRMSEVEHKASAERHKLREEFLENKVLVATSYLRKDTFRDSLSDIGSRLIRLEGKLDKAISRNVD